MKRTIAALVAASLFTTQALAAVKLDLSGDYVRIGVSDYGTIGSKSNTSPGILYDNSGTGTFNTAYDYLTPGSPFEGFGITLTTGGATTNYHNNNTGIQSITGGVLTDYSGVAYNGTTFDNRAVWTGSTTNFDLAHDYRFNNNQKFVDITTVLTAKADLTNLYFGRFTDPDARAAAGDSSATLNALGYGVIPSNQVVFSEATVSKYALGLYSADTNVGAGISNTWSPLGATYYGGANGGNGDYTIGLGWYLPTLANGATATYNYAYIFGPSAFAAGETAVTSGAGGGTPGVVPGCTTSCTLTDVGDASAPATPTLVSTVTNYSVASLTVSAAPTYAYSQTNTTSSGGVNLFVSRVNTTTASVLHTTTTTTTPVVVNTYSDSSTTSTPGTATVAVTTATTSTATATSETKSAPIDTYVNAAHLNLFNSELNLPNPLNRIDLSGVTIQRRTNSSNVKEVSNNTWVWLGGKLARGNDTRGNTVELGIEKIINDSTLVGAQLNASSNDMTKVESGSGKFDNIMINAYTVKKLGNWAVRPMIGFEKGRYKTSRTIAFTGEENFENAVYSNSLSTNSRAFSADLQVIAPRLGAYVTPYAGLGVKRYNYDDATESGTALTALTWKIEDTTIVKPYVGARFDSKETDKGLFFSADARITKFNVNQGRAPEGWTTINSRYGDVLVSVDTQVGYKFNPKAQAFAGYQHQHADQYNNNIIHLGVKIDF